MLKSVLEHIYHLAVRYSRSFNSGFKSLYGVQSMLTAHYPASNNYWKSAISTIEDVNIFPRQLLNLVQRSETFLIQEDLLDNPTLLGCPKRELSLGTVTDAFDLFGSDKSKTGLSLVYKHLLSSLPAGSSLLEIGIGTNNPKLVSSMGKNGKPGASLLAYELVLKDSFIYGVDIDPNIMVSTNWIKTAVADQMSLPTLMNLPSVFGVEKFDLIIDDGLHSPRANLNSLIFALKFSKPGGLIWIEDIPLRSLEIWWVVKALLQDHSSFFEIIKINENGFGVIIKTPDL